MTTSVSRREVLPVATLRRDRVSDRLDEPSRVTLVIAAAGYGKTVAVQHWAERRDEPIAWMFVDPLLADGVVFWRRFLVELSTVVPNLGPAQLAFENNPKGWGHLELLTAELEQLERRATIVLDGIGALSDPELFDNIEHLVNRAGDCLRFVLVSRVLPPLPLARWQAAGVLVEVNEDQLRFSADEAEAFASLLPDRHLAIAAVRRLNDRLEGWPIALSLLLGSRNGDSGHIGALSNGPADPLTNDLDMLEHLVHQVIDELAPDVHDGALVLSIAGDFDTELAYELLGPNAGQIVVALQRSRLLLSSGPPRSGRTRLHSVVARLLEGHLRWRDPARFDDLHRRAAKIHQRRGELGEAYDHLVAIGDAAGAALLVIEPTLQLVDRGDRVALAQMLNTFPLTARVNDARLALDLAQSCFFAGDSVAAYRWCTRAEELGVLGDVALELHWHSTSAVLELMNGHLDEAQQHVDAFVVLEPQVRTDGPIERSFVTVGARLALVRSDLTAARALINRARLVTGPPVITDVGIPALQAWHNVTLGCFDVAREQIDAALAAAERLQVRPHHAAFEALTTSAWVRFYTGDLDGALAAAGAATLDADRLGYDWNRIRAGVILAGVRSVVDGPHASLAVVREVRAVLKHSRSALADQLNLVEAHALTRLGRTQQARMLVSDAPDSAAACIARAAVELGDGHRDEALGSLPDTTDWSTPDRVAGELLRAAALEPEGDVAGVERVLAEAAEIGLVAPFLAYGGMTEALVRRAAPSTHPRVAELLGSPRRDRIGRQTMRVTEPLTTRELTLIALLPTHLSYAGIGERLFLSVNTVKSNLKSIYRKLGVTTRADAVDAAKESGLL